MTVRVKNNGGGIPHLPSEMDLDIEQDTDGKTPFIAVTIQDSETGAPILDLIIEDESEADAFLEDVQVAVRRFKKTKV